ncbi:MAG: hypothetical protein GY799_25385 [Desulfobulbaceae bacterium]|nr:hypothetical protein [Desulfobulbaceae bacterium]
MLTSSALIITRLRAADIGSIFTTIDHSSIVPGAENIPAYCPAAFVQCGSGTHSGTEKRNGFVEDQTIPIFVCAKYESTVDGAISNPDAVATPLLSLVVSALHNWKPSSDFVKPLKYVSRDEASIFPGWAQYTLYFDASVDVSVAQWCAAD